MEDNKYTILHEETKDLDIYFHTSFEDLKGYLSGKSVEEIFAIKDSIHKCKCGGDVELHEFECMGDGSYQIVCKECGREIERSQYDYDIATWDDVLDFCIRDWNNGLTSKDIKAANKKESDRKRLTADDFVWKDWHANNMIDNPIEGIYCLLFAKKGDKIYGCKWTIEYQHKESGPMCITNEIESYNLFMERFFEVKAPLSYPEPTEFCDRVDENISFPGLGVNTKGDFVRNYSTLDKAKKGALERCGWQGLNKDTLIKDVVGKCAEDLEGEE